MVLSKHFPNLIILSNAKNDTKRWKVFYILLKHETQYIKTSASIIQIQTQINQTVTEINRTKTQIA